jgi:hypothetical protein
MKKSIESSVTYHVHRGRRRNRRSNREATDRCAKKLTISILDENLLQGKNRCFGSNNGCFGVSYRRSHAFDIDDLRKLSPVRHIRGESSFAFCRPRFFRSRKHGNIFLERSPMERATDQVQERKSNRCLHSIRHGAPVDLALKPRIPQTERRWRAPHLSKTKRCE